VISETSDLEGPGEKIRRERSIYQHPKIRKGPLHSNNDRFPFLANLLDPRYRGNYLCVEETDKAMEHILKNYPDLMTSMVNYKAKTGPFHQYTCLGRK